MDSDESLYQQVRAGEMAAFDQLYARYETRLFGFLYSILGHRADAEDVFHEAFLRALKSREVTFDRGSFRTWLYRIARNAALNHARSRERAERAMATLAEPETAPRDDAAPADTALERRELLHALDGAIARLPPALSEVYHLRTSGLSYDEIAAVLEIPIGTLKSRMNQMVVRLREDMKPWTAPQ